MKYKDDWIVTQEKFKLWWQGKNSGRPLIRIVAERDIVLEPLEEVKTAATPQELYLDVDNNLIIYRNYCKSHIFMGEAYPAFSCDLGPGSMALYLGAEPNFSYDTVWFRECIKEWKDWQELKFNSDNHWWKTHLNMLQRAKEASNGDFFVNIADIIENLDIPLVMRGTEKLIYDMMDEPETIKRCVRQIDDAYFKYYNAMYEIVKGEDNSSSYTAFHIWGPGKTAKVQCDFSAMMSPNQYREFVLPSLKKQCKQLNQSLYHLDGPDAIKHVDAIMEIQNLNALQWTCGAGQPDGGCEKWYPIYDKVRSAGKSLWIMLYDGTPKDWVQSAEKLIKRYGTSAMYLTFPDMDEKTAKTIMEKVEREWR